MVYLTELRGFKQIIEEWQNAGGTGESARKLTIEQVDRFVKIVKDDKLWLKLLEAFKQGRAHDSWLAEDWPRGFDELVICAPLCKYVEWECAKCYVGTRQKNYSCANDDSLFGYIGALLSLENRELLIRHLQNVENLLTNDELYWDIDNHEIYISKSEIF